MRISSIQVIVNAASCALDEVEGFIQSSIDPHHLIIKTDSDKAKTYNVGLGLFVFFGVMDLFPLNESKRGGGEHTRS